MPRIEGWEISDDCATTVDALNEHGFDVYVDIA